MRLNTTRRRVLLRGSLVNVTVLALRLKRVQLERHTESGLLWFAVLVFSAWPERAPFSDRPPKNRPTPPINGRGPDI
jgi:hypothetical protein